MVTDTALGPPIYAAAEYNILGRLMHYVPMHAPLNPDRLLWVFIYMGTAVETLTAAGAARYAVARGDPALYRSGGLLVSIALVLQAVVECLFIATVLFMYKRCVRAGTLPKNVQRVCLTLYGTSALVLVRCIARAVEAFSVYTASSCHSFCLVLLEHEWYLYVFEAAPMLLYTVWLNFMHPGYYLPKDRKQFLDLDGKTERMGPGWVDKRARWKTFMNPFDVQGNRVGKPNHEQYWVEAERWPISDAGCFAQGTGSNVRRAKGGSR
jgi:hypothetical protein